MTPSVLISDDDPTLLRALGRMARNAGLDPILDDKGEVLSLARLHQPALILLDLHQPAVDGRWLLARLKADASTAAIGVAVMSGSHEEELQEECLALGALAFLPKPFDILWFDLLARRVHGAARSSA